MARLHTDKAFTDRIASMFEGDYKIVHHMAPPPAGPAQRQGRVGQAVVRPWMRKALGLLSRLKGLRGSALDMFGKTEERRVERALIVQYRECMEELIAGLTPERLAPAVEIAQIPNTSGLWPCQGTPPAGCTRPVGPFDGPVAQSGERQAA